MRQLWLAAALAMLLVVLVSCTSSPPPKTVARPTSTPPTTTTTTTVAAPMVAMARVPTDLVGKTIRVARVELVEAGFTQVVTSSADSAKVATVSHAGQLVPVGTAIALTGAARSTAKSRCQQDETQCFMEGRRCATGSCVNAARGLTLEDVRRQTDRWLSHHPGYCAAGVTGAVGPCRSKGDDAGSDPNMRDANGETKAEYCARIGYPLATCPAG